MRKITLLAFTINCIAAFGQNMVINPSFEEYDNCPSLYGEIYPPEHTGPLSVTGWSSAVYTTPDYFNECAPFGSYAGVPVNLFGYQEAKDGKGYAGGLVNNHYEGFQEYVQGQLNSSLLSGHEIFMHYWIVSATAPVPGELGLRNMGAFFSPNYIYYSMEELHPLYTILEIPQIVSAPTRIFNDTENWESISGTFIAEGGEQWFTLGNFPLVDSDTSGWNPQAIYYDKVCVLDMDGDPSIAFKHEQVNCSDEFVTLNAPSINTHYLWDDGSSLSSRSVSVSGKYWVRSVDTENCNLQVDTFMVDMKYGDVNLGNDTVICANISFILNVQGDYATSYQWNTGDTTPSILIDQPGVYFVEAIGECFTGRDTIVVTTIPAPKADLPNDTTVCKGDILELGAPQQSVSYLWNNGYEGCCISTDQPGNYVVKLTNVCGESDTGEIEVVHTNCDNCILIPSAFSPNGDGLNDLFKVLPNCMISSYTLSIFNRWGQQVFVSYNFDNSWDGTFNGKPLDVGVYFYRIEAESAFRKDDIIRKSGDVTLIR